MLSVDIEKIIPVTEARDMFNKIVDEVEGSDELYVLTKNGKPAAVVVGVNHLEKLTGETSNEVMAKVDKAVTDEPKEETEEAIKPFNTASAAPAEPPATPPADEPTTSSSGTPAADTFASTPTDTFSATPTSPSAATSSSDFNAAPEMPNETANATEIPDPMAPVTDGDGEKDEPIPPAPTSTPTTDPFAPPTAPAPNTDAYGSHSPSPGASGNTNATPPPNSN